LASKFAFLCRYVESTTQSGKAVNSMRYPNHTNVHTHGLHIDPAVDNVMLHAAPGETLVYAYTIPDNHMAGTHWYHSHQHGSSALQVGLSLFTTLCCSQTPVDDDSRYDPFV
jgi:hypothetical protein